MKNLKVTTGILAITFITLTAMACKNETKKDNDAVIKNEQPNEMAMTSMNFGVRGNCELCKSTIEKAANSVDGVTKAVWDVDKKKIDVSFDDTKTNEMAIHQAIAASGYDTEKVSGDLDAYNNLPGCCHYDHEMAMNQMK